MFVNPWSPDYRKTLRKSVVCSKNKAVEGKASAAIRRCTQTNIGGRTRLMTCSWFNYYRILWSSVIIPLFPLKHFHQFHKSLGIFPARLSSWPLFQTESIVIRRSWKSKAMIALFVEKFTLYLSHYSSSSLDNIKTTQWMEHVTPYSHTSRRRLRATMRHESFPLFLNEEFEWQRGSHCWMYHDAAKRSWREQSVVWE